METPAGSLDSTRFPGILNRATSRIKQIWWKRALREFYLEPHRKAYTQSPRPFSTNKESVPFWFKNLILMRAFHQKWTSSEPEQLVPCWNQKILFFPRETKWACDILQVAVHCATFSADDIPDYNGSTQNWWKHTLIHYSTKVSRILSKTSSRTRATVVEEGLRQFNLEPNPNIKSRTISLPRTLDLGFWNWPAPGSGT